MYGKGLSLLQCLVDSSQSGRGEQVIMYGNTMLPSHGCTVKGRGSRISKYCRSKLSVLY